MSAVETLALRRTHGYVGTYRHLDKWEDIGTIEMLSSATVNTDEEDHCEPMRTTHHVIVDAQGMGNRMIVKALRDHFSVSGCAHEHDCCGCRSYYAGKIKRRTGDLWCVEVDSSRNF